MNRPQLNKGWWRLASGKLVLTLAVVLALTSTGALTQALSEARDQLIRELAVDAVIFESPTESIELVGRPTPGIKIEVTRIGFGYTPEAAQRVLGRLSVEVTEAAGTARVSVTRVGGAPFEGRAPHAEVRIEVPSGATVEVRTTSGVVRVRELNATIRIATGNGGVNATGAAGSLQIQTTSGGVRVSEFGRGRVEIETGSGLVEVLGGGPLELKAASATGQIVLREVEGRLAVTTATGDISIERARNASLNVETTRGAVTFSGSLQPGMNSLISTTAGSVRVALPRTAGFRLIATSVNGPVNVTFPITATERARNVVVGSAGAGEGLLRLTTTSGPIEVIPLD